MSKNYKSLVAPQSYSSGYIQWNACADRSNKWTS